MRTTKRQRHHMIQMHVTMPHTTTTQMAAHPITSQHIRPLNIPTPTHATPLRRTIQLVRSAIALLRTELCVDTHRLRKTDPAMRAKPVRTFHGSQSTGSLFDSVLVLRLAHTATKDPRPCCTPRCDNHGIPTEVTATTHSRATNLDTVASTTPRPILPTGRWRELAQDEILTTLRAMLRTSQLGQKAGETMPVPPIVEIAVG